MAFGLATTLHFKQALRIDWNAAKTVECTVAPAARNPWTMSLSPSFPRLKSAALSAPAALHAAQTTVPQAQHWPCRSRLMRTPFSHGDLRCPSRLAPHSPREVGRCLQVGPAPCTALERGERSGYGWPVVPWRWGASSVRWPRLGEGENPRAAPLVRTPCSPVSGMTLGKPSTKDSLRLPTRDLETPLCAPSMRQTKPLDASTRYSEIRTHAFW